MKASFVLCLISWFLGTSLMAQGSLTLRVEGGRAAWPFGASFDLLVECRRPNQVVLTDDLDLTALEDLEPQIQHVASGQSEDGHWKTWRVRCRAFALDVATLGPVRVFLRRDSDAEPLAVEAFLTLRVHSILKGGDSGKFETPDVEAGQRVLPFYLLPLSLLLVPLLLFWKSRRRSGVVVCDREGAPGRAVETLRMMLDKAHAPLTHPCRVTEELRSCLGELLDWPLDAVTGEELEAALNQRAPWMGSLSREFAVLFQACERSAYGGRRMTEAEVSELVHRACSLLESLDEAYRAHRDSKGRDS